MSEEIKEILDKLQKVAKRETASRNALIEMKDKDYQLLLDYITNLQQENERLKECYCNRTDCGGRIKDSKKYDSVQQRLDKIIAHLGNCDWNNKDFEKIYDIATGSDEE
jgi:hypothetical protein